MAASFDPFMENGDGFFSTLNLGWLHRKRAGRGLRGDQALFKEEGEKIKNAYGFYGDLYCPLCQETFDFLFVEFEKPDPDFLSKWRQTIIEEMNQDVMQCPRCGHAEMELV